jgi:hypothetical protein
MEGLYYATAGCSNNGGYIKSDGIRHSHLVPCIPCLMHGFTDMNDTGIHTGIQCSQYNTLFAVFRVAFLSVPGIDISKWNREKWKMRGQ